MAFSWIVGLVTLTLIVILIVTCIIGVKKQKFTLNEIGRISFAQETDQTDVLFTSPYASVLYLAIIRSIIGIFALITFIYRLILGTKKGVPSVCWFTVWGWFLLTIYFILLPLLTFIVKTDKCECLKREKLINYIRILIWIIFECLLSLAIFIDFTVWGFNYNYEELLTFTEFTMHSLNFVFVLMELMINDVPLANIYHSLFSLFVAVTYVIFAWIVHAIFNVPFPYPFIDYNDNLNGIVIPSIAIIIFVFWSISYGFREYFIKQCLRKSNSINKADTDLRTNSIEI